MIGDRLRCLDQVGTGAEDSDEDLDPAAVLARVGGNVPLLQELAEMFLEDCPKWMAEIRDMIDQGNASGLRYCAHQLRGSVGNFGTPAAYDRAQELEAIARTGDLTSAADVYSLLEKAIRRFQQALNQFGQESAAGVPARPEPAVEPSGKNDSKRQTRP